MGNRGRFYPLYMETSADNRGFTLIELAIVLAVLALVAVLAVGRHGTFKQDARIMLSQREMGGMRDALHDYLEDMGSVPGFSPAYLRVANLLAATNLYALGGRRADIDAGDWDGLHHAQPEAFRSWNAETGRGWRGPYLLAAGAAAPADVFPEPEGRSNESDATFAERGFFPKAPHLSLPDNYRDGYVYGFPGEPALLDPWGDPYVLQIPPAQAFVTASGGLADVPDEERFRYARLVSAGPDGILATPCFFANTNASGSAWRAVQRRASIFAGRPADRGDDLVLFLSREDRYRETYDHEGDER